MSTDGTQRSFEDALDALSVGWTRTPPEEFREALAAVVSEPAVAAPLPFDDVALPDDLNVEPTPADLRSAETGVTGACLGIADYGSVVLPATPGGTEPVSLFPRRHVAVLRAADVVPGMPEAFERLGPHLRETRGSAVVATGPSATADMGELVRGAHGPEEVHVLVVATDGRPGGDAAGTTGEVSDA